MEVEERRTKLHRLVAMGLRIQVMVVGMQVAEEATVMVVVVESDKPAEEVNGKLGSVQVGVGVKETAEDGIGWAEVVRVMVGVGVHDTLYTVAVEVGEALYTAVVGAVNRPVEGENRQVEEVGEISKDRLVVEVNVAEEAASWAVVEESTMAEVVESWAGAVNCSSKQVGVERTREEEVGESSVVEVGVMVGRTPAPVVAMVGEETAEEEMVEVVAESKPVVVVAVEMVGVVMVEVEVESKPVGAAVGVMVGVGKVVVEKAEEETGEVGVESKLAVVGVVETGVAGMVEAEEESKQVGEEEMGMAVAEGVAGKWDVKRIQVAEERKQVAMAMGQQQVAEKAPPQVATEQHKKDIQKNCNPQA